MGFFDSWSEFVAAAMPWETVEAEAPEKPEEKDDAEESDEKEESEDKDGEKEPAEEEEGGEEEEEEEEEEEMVDPKEKLEEECKESKQCAPAKHHFDECVERVTGANQSDKKEPDEDCVEEFFHLAHCAGECAAPKLWAQLK